MTDRRHKNGTWLLDNLPGGKVSANDAQLAVLMDIRDELQQINWQLQCQRIPRALDAVVMIEKRLALKYPLRRK